MIIIYHQILLKKKYKMTHVKFVSIKVNKNLLKQNVIIIYVKNVSSS